MSITRDNYESWFLDFGEGNLDKDGMEKVRLFLIQHPDLANELENPFPTLDANHYLSYPNKGQLKKTNFDEPEYFENSAIAYPEGDMDPTEQAEFERWVSNRPEKQKVIRQLAASRLKPDLAISFPDRERLKQKTIVFPVWNRVAAVAAILLLALFTFYPDQKENLPISNFSAEVNSPKIGIPLNRQTVSATQKPVALTLAKQKKPIQKRMTSTSISKTIDNQSNTTRAIENLAALSPKSYPVITFEPAFTDLVPIQLDHQSMMKLADNGEITLTDYFQNKLRLLKAITPNEFFTREEFAFAGLRLFSKLPGRHLTGKKGLDGRLKSISFNTQLLAFSIPVNKEL